MEGGREEWRNEGRERGRNEGRERGRNEGREEDNYCIVIMNVTATLSEPLYAWSGKLVINCEYTMIHRMIHLVSSLCQLHDHMTT